MVVRVRWCDISQWNPTLISLCNHRKTETLRMYPNLSGYLVIINETESLPHTDPTTMAWTHLFVANNSNFDACFCLSQLVQISFSTQLFFSPPHTMHTRIFFEWSHRHSNNTIYSLYGMVCALFSIFLSFVRALFNYNNFVIL